jgi:hypothetical protein
MAIPACNAALHTLFERSVSGICGEILDEMEDRSLAFALRQHSRFALLGMEQEWGTSSL